MVLNWYHVFNGAEEYMSVHGVWNNIMSLCHVTHLYHTRYHKLYVPRKIPSTLVINT